MKPGGTKGGDSLFIWGLGLFLLGFGAYLLLDSVRVVAGHGGGALSGAMRDRGMNGTLSNTLVFTPFFLGVGVMFYAAKKKWAWVLTGFGIVFFILEIISRTRFQMNIKVSHMLLLLLMMASGTGLILRSYFQLKNSATSPKQNKIENKPKD